MDEVQKAIMRSSERWCKKMDGKKFFEGKTKKEKSRQQEKKVAKEAKGRTTIASGALSFDKADVIGKFHFRVECKRTDKEQLIFKKIWWNKLSAQSRFEIPSMHIQIGELEAYLIRPEEFKLIQEYLEEKF